MVNSELSILPLHLDKRIRVNVRGAVGHVNILVVGSCVALGEGNLAREVQRADKRHEFDVAVAAVLFIVTEGRDVGRAAIHVAYSPAEIDPQPFI